MAIIAEFDLALREATPPGEAEHDQIIFCGEPFDIVEQVSAMPLMRWAYAVNTPEATEDEVLAAAYALLQHCIVGEPATVDGQQVGGWARFQRVASDHDARLPHLVQVAGAVYRHVTGRPTRRSTDFSDGPLTTSETSKPDSSSPAAAPPLRPDLAEPMVSVDDLL